MGEYNGPVYVVCVDHPVGTVHLTNQIRQLEASHSSHKTTTLAFKKEVVLIIIPH